MSTGLVLRSAGFRLRSFRTRLARRSSVESASSAIRCWPCRSLSSTSVSSGGADAGGKTPDGAGRWTAKKVRSTFLHYFVDANEHRFVPSSPVVPWNDPTLAFVNAGMNQFKNVFLGEVQPPYPRVANTQKCIRVGGKHNDLDAVGKDGYHHTFFEMMGNWSFRDYGKEKACFYALDLLTRVYEIPLSRLYFTYFGGDERTNLPPDVDTKNVWLQLGVPPERILEFGPEDNFWDMGAVGPCGPCTEIHYDHAWGGRPVSDVAALVNSGDPTVTELWNVVFIDHERTEGGALRPLGKTYVDTGMGFERLVAVLNGKISNYDTDVFEPVFDVLQSVSGCRKYSGSFADDATLDESYRIMADHARMFTVAAADGLLPAHSHKLRNVVHRFCYHAEKSFDVLGADLIPPVCDAVLDSLASGYPDLPRSRFSAAAVVADEARRYGELKAAARGLCFSLGGHDAVDRLRAAEIHEHPGLVNLIDELNRLVRTGRAGGRAAVVAADDAARMCLSNDVPVDLFRTVVGFKGLGFDEAAVRDRVAEALSAAGDGAGDGPENVRRGADPRRAELLRELTAADLPATKDGAKYAYKYDKEGGIYRVAPIGAEILFVKPTDGGDDGVLTANRKVTFVLDRTPFYAEKGGQSCDAGYLRSKAGLIRVEQVYFVGGDDYVVHEGTVLIGEFRRGDRIIAEVDPERRTRIALNHTGVHMLNGALRALARDPSLVAQKSSWVGPDYARFDFVCGDDAFKQGTSVDDDGILPVEDYVNSLVAVDRRITRHITTWTRASEFPNLVTVPGEVYPEAGLTVIEIPGCSLEPCCGTHATNSAHLRKFVVTQNKSVQAGVRSVKFATGPAAEEVELQDEEFGKWFDELLEEVSDDGGRVVDAVKASEVMKNARRMLASAENLSYRKRKSLQAVLDSRGEVLRRSAKKQIVSMMEGMMKRAVENSKRNINYHVACYLDFGPDCASLDVPLAKASKMCPPDLPSAIFSVSKGHIIGRCVVPASAVTDRFSAEAWMKPIGELLKVDVKAPKGQDPALVVGLRSERLPSTASHDDALVVLAAAVRVADEVYPALTRIRGSRSEETIA